MTRRSIILSAALAALTIPCALSAQAAVPHYSDAYPVGALIDNPATKAVLDARIPGFSNGPQIPQMRGMALKDVEAAPTSGISMATRKLINDDLAAIPVGAPLLLPAKP